MTVKMYVGDPNESQSYVSRRLAIGITILILYFIHFLFQALAYFPAESKIHKHKLHHLSKKIYLFTVAAFISFNYLQGGLFEAILAWFVLFYYILQVFMLLSQKILISLILKNKLWVFYYIMIFIYFLGIIISFYMSEQRNNKAIISETM